jgi:excisionase family DNA binding protein
MAYAPHRIDLIRSEAAPRGAVVLYRTIAGLEWSRHVEREDYLTPMEAAVALGVHRVTMYDWISGDLLPAYEGEGGETWLLWGEVFDFVHGRKRGR